MCPPNEFSPAHVTVGGAKFIKPEKEVSFDDNDTLREEDNDHEDYDFPGDELP